MAEWMHWSQKFEFYSVWKNRVLIRRINETKGERLIAGKSVGIVSKNNLYKRRQRQW